MSQGDAKRQRIFDKYSSNLHFLNDNGLIPKLNLKFENTYVCPGCMEQFSVEDLSLSKKNHLTLEDIPPKSLGGKPTILTCKGCNNIAGHQIDSQLYSKMFEMDKRKFIPGSTFKARFRQGDEVVQGEVLVEKDGTIKIRNNYNNNKRERLDNFIKDISPSTGNPLMNIEFIPSKIHFKRLEVALLKTAYLLCFEKYGYLTISDPVYDAVREQIKNPDQDIYPTKFWFVGQFDESQQGVHVVNNEGLECFMAIFSLKSLTTRTFAAILPIKKNPIIQTVAAFHASIALEVDEPAKFRRYDNPKGYLDDLDSIKEITFAIDEIRNR